MISTRGRYAVRVMIDLAEHEDGSFIPLRDIAQRQELSKKYLEIIMKDLVSGGLLAGARGFPRNIWRSLQKSWSTAIYLLAPAVNTADTNLQKPPRNTPWGRFWN